MDDNFLKTRSVMIKVPGTCGELIQGWYREWNKAVLVSCPIARYSQVTVSLRADAAIITPDDQAPHYSKIRQAVMKRAWRFWVALP